MIDKGCTGKTRYSAQQAERVAAKKGRNCNAYHCARCGRWHIGHSPRTIEKTVFSIRNANDQKARTIR